MYEPTISPTRVCACFFWALSFAVFVASWSLFLIGHPRTGYILGITAAVTTAWAATLQVRCWAIRITALIRETKNLPPASRDGDGQVYSLHR